MGNFRKLDWEIIDSEQYGHKILRAKIFGGWILRLYASHQNNYSDSIAFSPDPKHEWIIEK